MAKSSDDLIKIYSAKFRKNKHKMFMTYSIFVDLFPKTTTCKRIAIKKLTMAIWFKLNFKLREIISFLMWRNKGKINIVKNRYRVRIEFSAIEKVDFPEYIYKPRTIIERLLIFLESNRFKMFFNSVMVGINLNCNAGNH